MNLALLAKHGWRVATQEASLLFKLLEGRVQDVEASHVLAIPLSRRLPRDRIIWHYTRSGYLTCSGYKCARVMKRNGDLRGVAWGECSSGRVEDPCWKSIWHLQVPPRVNLLFGNTPTTSSQQRIDFDDEELHLILNVYYTRVLMRIYFICFLNVLSLAGFGSPHL
ncbi:hypothetical protein LIER_36950 [Lithospermum erythrorhizon]|uniref:Uncharacterized protein n=1 Tax=Lithospermum erythrorhizon TaxID=34254 RepID=A0AAV3PF31_LITER